MGKYNTYQETSYRWLPQVPAHWSKKSIRQITSVLSERCGNRNLRLLSVYREYGVIPKDSRDDNHNKESLDLSNYKVVHVGNLVLNKMKMWQGSLGVSRYEGIVSPAYIICKVLDDDINLDYLHLLLRSARFKSYYNQYSYGIRVGQWDMHYGDFKNLKIFIPPRAEQDQIVRFLDWKVSEINKLIGIRRKEIQELEELKSRVIYHTVLGEDNVIENKKDTGIGWIGKVPENWDLRRIKFLFRLRDEKNYKPLSEVNLLSLYSSLGIIQNKDVEYTTGNRARNADGYKIVKANDIVVNIILCWMGAIGMSDYDGVTSPAYDVYTPQKNVCSKYYHYLFRTKPFSNECYKAGKGIMAMRWRVYFPQFSNIVVPFPPLKEQEEIAETLNDKCKGVDTLITIKQEQVGKLRELKSTLISDVVTGKIDVRNIPVPAYEHVDDLTADDGEGNDGETGIPGEED